MQPPLLAHYSPLPERVFTKQDILLGILDEPEVPNHDEAGQAGKVF